jgi:hypothetical protein
MADDIDGAGEAAKAQAAQPDSTPNKDPKSEKSELPEVEAPALSPAADAPEPEPVPDSALVILPPQRDAGAQAAPPRFRLRPRHRRHAVLAASVALAAGLGLLSGRLLGSYMNAPAPDSAALKREQAMQHTIGQLGKEVASLKASVAATHKAAQSEIAKVSKKITDRLRSAPAITGSIPVPPASVPTPVPRPPQRAASHVVPDWAIHDVYDGRVYVSGHGDIYQVARGAPLPGLGPIEKVERRYGRWVVVTPKGLIVARRDRRFFEAN